MIDPSLRGADDDHTQVATLANGVRVLSLRLPHLRTACASVFVRSGSAHERPADNGISHVVEHMVFKGSASRNARQINLDAERLGAEVNAHTDKDHSAFHMRGLAEHAGLFVQMLGDIVLGPTFPPDELLREREVLLQELAEDEDDPISVAFQLFDRSCWGTHGVAQPVIGSRRNIERFDRAALQAYVQRQYTGVNLVLAVAGPIDHEHIVAQAQAAFGALAAGQANLLPPPVWQGGQRTRRMAGTSQAHLVMGFALPGLREDPVPGTLAATLFGEGMSSPLMDELRERRGLLYYAASSADLLDCSGQLVVEASTAADKLELALTEVVRLLTGLAGRVDEAELQRAKNQLLVRQWRLLERPARRLESAALDLLALGRVRPHAALCERIQAVQADELAALFAGLVAQPAAVAATGALGRGVGPRLRAALAAGAA